MINLSWKGWEKINTMISRYDIRSWLCLKFLLIIAANAWDRQELQINKYVLLIFAEIFEHIPSGSTCIPSLFCLLRTCVWLSQGTNVWRRSSKFLKLHALVFVSERSMHFNPNSENPFLFRIALADQVEEPCLCQSQRVLGWRQDFYQRPETSVCTWGFNFPLKSRKVNGISPFGF